MVFKYEVQFVAFTWTDHKVSEEAQLREGGFAVLSRRVYPQTQINTHTRQYA